METAVAYIRVSSQRQVEEGGSLDSQTKQVDQYVQSTGYQLARVFREEGESAKTDQRPRLQEMLLYCRDKKNQVAVVIVPKIDRLARNVSDYTNLKLQLTRLGIRLESLGERIEDTPVGRFTETILASVAQFDNEIRAERSKGGMVEAVTQGRWVWHAPFGLRNIRVNGKGNIEPDPTFAPMAQEVFRLLAYGHQSQRAVQEHLKRLGVDISLSTLYKMVHNEKYIGRIHAFGKVFEAQPPFVPLVDELTFYKAQAALKPAKTPQRYQLESEDFPLRGSMLCPCGRLFTASWSRGEQQKRYPYYRCMHCGRRSYARKTVDGYFSLELGTYRGNERGWDRLKSKLMAYAETVSSAQSGQRAKGLDRIEELKTLRDAVVLKNASGVIPDDLAKRQIERLGKEIADVAGEIPADTRQTDAEELIAFARRFFEELQTTWKDLSLKTKKDLLRFMYPEGVLFHPERGFRTPGNALSERFKRVVSGSNSSLVDPGPEFCNELHEWLQRLQEVVGCESAR